MSRWIIQYVYENNEGKTRISIDRIKADSKQEAIEKASRIAPADNFLVSAHPESNEQYFDTVRAKAMTLSGKIGKLPVPDEEE